MLPPVTSNALGPTPVFSSFLISFPKTGAEFLATILRQFHRFD